jgi:transcriptional regulator with XRE-family HTH domain
MKLAHKLKRLREARGLSVTEVAKILGASRQAVYYWETGKRSPSAANLSSLFGLYKVDRDDRALMALLLVEGA